MRRLFACVVVLLPSAALAACGNDDSSAFDGGDAGSNGTADGSASDQDASDGSDSSPLAMTDACGCVPADFTQPDEYCATNRNACCPASLDAAVEWFNTAGPYNYPGSCKQGCRIVGCAMTVWGCANVDVSQVYYFDNGTGKLVAEQGSSIGGTVCAADPNDCPAPECFSGVCADD